MTEEQTNDQEEYTFRPNKKVFVLYILSSVFFMLFLIGFPILIAVILWYKFSYITLGKQGIHLHKGWLNVTDKQVPYEKVNTVESQQSWIDRMFDSGQIKIYTGNDIQGIAFQGIDQPRKIKQIIEQRVNRASKNAQFMQHSEQHSSADELAKYANLKEKGIITQEEFEIKKSQLLG